MKPEDEPYALKDIAERQRRLAMLGQPHIEPLAKYLNAIKAEHPDRDLPYFAPCDGGIHAEAINNASIENIRTMLTCCVRGERFCAGHWASALESGQIVALLRRLKQI